MFESCRSHIGILDVNQVEVLLTNCGEVLVQVLPTKTYLSVEVLPIDCYILVLIHLQQSTIVCR